MAGEEKTVRKVVGIVGVGLSIFGVGLGMLLTKWHPVIGVCLMAGGVAYLLWELLTSAPVVRTVPEGMLRFVAAVMISAFILLIVGPDIERTLHPPPVSAPPAFLHVEPAPVQSVPPQAVVTKPKVITPTRAAPKSSLEWLKIAKGLKEPEGAPREGGDNESLKEEARFNRMSLTQIRALIADDIERLQAFENEWSYPESQELDTPANQTGDEASQKAVHDYWERLAAKEKLEKEVRPAKRAGAFHKQFPKLAADIQYLGNKWPELKAPNDCFPASKMQEGTAQACAEYLKRVIDKYPRPQ